jgi:hypothetical protein
VKRDELPTSQGVVDFFEFSSDYGIASWSARLTVSSGFDGGGRFVAVSVLKAREN